MNPAVGKNSPPWLCIEGMHYSVCPSSSDGRKDHRAKLEPLEPPPPGYLNCYEAADIFGVTWRSVGRIAAKEGMQRVFVKRPRGACAYIRASDLEAYFSNARHKPRPGMRTVR